MPGRAIGCPVAGPALWLAAICCRAAGRSAHFTPPHYLIWRPPQITSGERAHTRQGVNRKYGSWDRITVRDGQAVSPRPPTRLVVQESRTRRQSEAPGHIAPRKLDRGKPAFLADKATEVLVGWERIWERILLAPALGGSRPLAWALC